MNTLIFNVYKNTVERADGFNPVSAENNYSKLLFKFKSGDDWEKCSIVTASFFVSADDVIKSTANLITDALTVTFDIPQILRNTTDKIKVGITGTYTDVNVPVTIATNIITLNVNKGIIVTDEAKMDLYENIILIVNDYFEQTKSYNIISTSEKYVDISLTKTSGEYYNYLTLSKVSSEIYEHTSLIECVLGDKFKVTGSYGYGACLCAFFDANKNFISYYGISPGSSVATAEIITIPDNVKYMSVNNKPATTTLLVQKYKSVNVYLKDAISKLQTDTTPVLFGKTIYADGDSIAYGQGNSGISYADMIATYFSMSLTKAAVGGTTLAIRDGRTDSIFERINALTGSYDYILIEGGINDMFTLSATKFGTLSNSYNNADFDTSTTVGALESICYKLINEFDESKILFVLTHRKNDVILTSTSTTVAYTTKQRQLWDLLITVLKKWGVPYVDLSAETHLSAWNKTLADKYFAYADNQGQGDGTHPTKAAYEKFYVPQITAALKRI